MNHLIIGQGSIGKDVAIALNRLGQSVVGMARTPKTYPDGVGVRFWQKDALTLIAGDVADFDVIAIIITPQDDKDRVKAYQNSYFAVCQHIAGLGFGGKVVFISSTSVYGENAGEWVDELTKPNPTTPTAKVLLTAEKALTDTYGVRATIIRPSGIYGKSNCLIELAKSAHTAGVPSHHYANRIHHDDLVFVIVRVMMSDDPKSVYIVSDTKPATLADVMGFICQEQGFIPPAIMPSDLTGKRIRGNVDEWLTVKSYRQGYARSFSK
ncbi:MAG: NAD-dependent epimerase/dehydratase family protein [Moraxella sp.]|nr:NAD-dependent epimerase/dehydratase family protein [Moraxella sp.]